MAAAVDEGVDDDDDSSNNLLHFVIIKINQIYYLPYIFLLLNFYCIYVYMSVVEIFVTLLSAFSFLTKKQKPLKYLSLNTWLRNLQNGSVKTFPVEMKKKTN